MKMICLMPDELAEDEPKLAEDTQGVPKSAHKGEDEFFQVGLEKMCSSLRANLPKEMKWLITQRIVQFNMCKLFQVLQYTALPRAKERMAK